MVRAGAREERSRERWGGVGVGREGTRGGRRDGVGGRRYWRTSKGGCGGAGGRGEDLM